MKRNFENFDKYLDQLAGSIYAQPADDGHKAWTTDAFRKLVVPIRDKVSSVLDVGCGTGHSRPDFADAGIFEWVGCTLSDEEIQLAKEQGITLDKADFSFLPYYSNSFDMIFSRHSLEHSPMPLLTLMEWHRVSRKYLVVIVPSPDFWGVYGKNHFSVFPEGNWEALFAYSGWKIENRDRFMTSDPVFFPFFMPEVCREEVELPVPAQELEYRWLLKK